MAETLQAAQEKLSTMTGGLVGFEYNFPAFDELPKVEGMPQGSIWGFYDKNGKKDEIGCPSKLLKSSLDSPLTPDSYQPPHPRRRPSRFQGDQHGRTHPT